MDDTSTIADGAVVTMHYKLTLSGGQVIDSSEGQDPLAYLHGANNIVPGLEAAMGGKAAGESFEVSVAPEDGYGPRIDEAVQTVPRNRFPGDADLQAGLQFQATDPDGNPLMGTITQVEGDQVTVDFNHPLAGQTLNFSIEVVGIRSATDEEKESGQVQFPGGPQG